MMKNCAFVYIYVLFLALPTVTMQLHAYLPSYKCNHYPCQNDLALLSFLAVSERLFTENILSHYDAEEKVASHLLYYQKNVIELLLEKYLQSIKFIIRALFLQLTSGVDLSLQ